jgi:hypothetical protein
LINVVEIGFVTMGWVELTKYSDARVGWMKSLDAFGRSLF